MLPGIWLSNYNQECAKKLFTFSSIYPGCISMVERLSDIYNFTSSIADCKLSVELDHFLRPKPVIINMTRSWIYPNRLIMFLAPLLRREVQEPSELLLLFMFVTARSFAIRHYFHVCKQLVRENRHLEVMKNIVHYLYSHNCTS